MKDTPVFSFRFGHKKDAFFFGIFEAGQVLSAHYDIFSLKMWTSEIGPLNWDTARVSSSGRVQLTPPLGHRNLRSDDADVSFSEST